jgi:hypothetical protein
LLPTDAVGSQAPEIVPKPEDFPHTAEHVQRIADLENQVKMLKQQALTTMDQAAKSAALSGHVICLEEQMSRLKSKIDRLENGLLYMTELVEGANEQLLCKLIWSPLTIVMNFMVKNT